MLFHVLLQGHFLHVWQQRVKSVKDSSVFRLGTEEEPRWMETQEDCVFVLFRFVLFVCLFWYAVQLNSFVSETSTIDKQICFQFTFYILNLSSRFQSFVVFCNLIAYFYYFPLLFQLFFVGNLNSSLRSN